MVSLTNAVIEFELEDIKEIGEVVIGCNDENMDYQELAAFKIIREATVQEYLDFCKQTNCLHLVLNPEKYRHYFVEFLD